MLIVGTSGGRPRGSFDSSLFACLYSDFSIMKVHDHLKILFTKEKEEASLEFNFSQIFLASSSPPRPESITHTHVFHLPHHDVEDSSSSRLLKVCQCWALL